jgi:hypothetical protein
MAINSDEVSPSETLLPQPSPWSEGTQPAMVLQQDEIEFMAANFYLD